MASRAAVSYWRSLASARHLATSTTPKVQSHSSAAAAATDVLGHHGSSKFKLKSQFVPVFVALGLIAMSVTLGLLTAKQQLFYSPSVVVSKKRRETVPEVVDPDWAAVEADRFLDKSLFRRVAHLQDFDAIRAGISDPTRKPNIDRPRKVETLKSVGVDPSGLNEVVGRAQPEQQGH